MPVRVPDAELPWPRERDAAARGGELVRVQRHQRARDCERGAGAGRPGGRREHARCWCCRRRSRRRCGAGGAAMRRIWRRSRTRRWPTCARRRRWGAAHFAQRLAVMGATHEAVAASLRGFAAGTAGAGVEQGTAPGPDAVRPAFLFTGQGAQYGGMGRRCMRRSRCSARRWIGVRSCWRRRWSGRCWRSSSRRRRRRGC